ncbi:hypothetical protein MML48_9g00005388 [Holotrichia oblita]|uniref:Uncharacterized protein n=1 Tax=Holotrichia oblita TaxID=644536 RepID=A0ACB9SLX8_HOLOL|nr:hypothetical protein MML48_9g00005388 [Holotrichia oblita]
MDDDEAAAVIQIQQDIEEAEVDILAVPRRFLVNEDAFAISDAAFIKNFRLSKNLCRTLIELVRPYIVPPSRRSALTLETKVCDENLKIMNVNARFPASAHDAHIWRQSQISQTMEGIYRNVNNESFFLIGDSGRYIGTERM